MHSTRVWSHLLESSVMLPTVRPHVNLVHVCYVVHVQRACPPSHTCDPARRKQGWGSSNESLRQLSGPQSGQARWHPCLRSHRTWYSSRRKLAVATVAASSRSISSTRCRPGRPHHRLYRLALPPCCLATREAKQCNFLKLSRPPAATNRLYGPCLLPVSLRFLPGKILRGIANARPPPRNYFCRSSAALPPPPAFPFQPTKNHLIPGCILMCHA